MKRIGRFSLIAVVALSAMALFGAASASGSKFVSESSHTEYSGTHAGQHVFYFGGGSPSVTCYPAFSALQQGNATRTLETWEASGTCAGYSMQWNSCQLTFRPGAEVSAGKFDGSFDIGPSGCGGITVKNAFCTWSIPPQTGLYASFVNQGSGSLRTITVNAEASGLEYSRTQGLCGSGTEGRWNGTWNVKGLAAPGMQVGVYVAELPVGFFMAGEKSGEAAKQPRFEAEEYPADISGEVSKTHVFKTASAAETCSTGSLAGSVEKPIADLAVGATYGACTGPLGLPTTVKMNSCHYVLHVANAEPLYSGSADIACDKEGDAIEFVTNKSNGEWFCTRSFKAQTIGTATYKTVGEGNNRKVVAEVEGTGLKSSRTGTPLCGAATSESDTFSGGFTLEGVEQQS